MPPGPPDPRAEWEVGTRRDPEAVVRPAPASLRTNSFRTKSFRTNSFRTAPLRAARLRGWQAARVGLPAAVIVTVGAGAVLLLTGKTSLTVTDRGNVTAPIARSGGSAVTVDSARTFPGYPGQQGSEDVTSIASASGLQVAVGSADGHAAIWRRGPDGAWSLLSSVHAVSQTSGLTTLTSVAHGPAGWLAIGNVASGSDNHPVVLTSADGLTWQEVDGDAAFAQPGVTVNAVAASSVGYVIVGSQSSDGAPSDAMWWSSNLKSWTRGGDTIMSTVSSVGSGMADSEIFGVTATPAGFIAVGTHNGCHTAWVTSDGQHWQSYDIPKPGGTQTPMLREVAVSGNLIVAGGDLGVQDGRIPLVVFSSDGGVHWQETTLGDRASFTGSQGTVTAITTDASGFVAAGLIGPPSAQHAVTWTSPDGIHWSKAKPASSTTRQITVMTAAGKSLTSIARVAAQDGTESVEVSSPAP